MGQNKVLAICLDCGDTLIDEGTEVKDERGVSLRGDLVPGAAELVRELKRRGYPLALVADGPAETFPNNLAPHGLYDLFDVYAISSVVGAEKPDPRMFVCALNQLSIGRDDYGRVIMLGNNLGRDIRGANALGMISVWLDWSPRRSKVPRDGSEAPDYTIKSPAELLGVLETLEARFTEDGVSSRIITLAASYYQQFDADYALQVPGEGYGGWRQAEIEISLDRTAVVVMHAWDTGTPEEYPGWYWAVEYMPRGQAILREVFPPLLATVRAANVCLFHVVGGEDYYQEQAGYRRALRLAGQQTLREQIPTDPTLDRLRQFRRDHVFVGAHNQADVRRGFENLAFAPQAMPEGDEGVAENAEQLFALCKDAGVNHLIYGGFAVNWCLLMSPGGMLDMSRRGLMCSVFRQAVTAVENRETARLERHKESALWRVALAFGFVFDVDDFGGKVSGLASL